MKKLIFTGIILPILFSFGKMRGMNIQLQAYCPDCKRTVMAFLLSGSLEKLQKNEADVEVIHSTTKAGIGAHKWVLVNPRDRADVRKRLAERLIER